MRTDGAVEGSCADFLFYVAAPLSWQTATIGMGRAGVRMERWRVPGLTVHFTLLLPRRRSPRAMAGALQEVLKGLQSGGRPLPAAKGVLADCHHAHGFLRLGFWTWPLWKARSPVNRALRGGVVSKTVYFLSKRGSKW